MKDIKWMLANYSSGEIARDAISEIINLEQELAKLREDNEKLRFQLDVAEAVLSVQVTKSALAYFEDKIKALEE